MIVHWILANSGSRMERSRLRRCMGIKYADLDPLLKELASKGKIKISRGIIELI